MLLQSPLFFPVKMKVTRENSFLHFLQLSLFFFLTFSPSVFLKISWFVIIHGSFSSFFFSSQVKLVFTGKKLIIFHLWDIFSRVHLCFIFPYRTSLFYIMEGGQIPPTPSPSHLICLNPPPPLHRIFQKHPQAKTI